MEKCVLPIGEKKPHFSDQFSITGYKTLPLIFSAYTPSKTEPPEILKIAPTPQKNSQKVKEMKKIKKFFKKLDLKNNSNTVLAIIMEIILLGDIIIATLKGISLFGYISTAVIAMMYVGLSEYNLRRFLKLKEKNDYKSTILLFVLYLWRPFVWFVSLYEVLPFQCLISLLR